MLQAKISKSINLINLFSCILLTVSAIYYTKVQQAAFYLFFVSYFLEIFIDKKWKNFRFSKVKIYYLVLLLFFLLIFIYHPFENSTKYFYRLVELRLALFGFAIVGFFGLNKYYKVSYFAHAFIVSSILAMVYLICGIGLQEFISNPQRAALVTAFRIAHINSHIVFNAYLNIALICCWYLIFNSHIRYRVSGIIFYVLSALSIIYFLFISEGRIGIAVAAVLLFSISIYQLWKIHKLYVAVVILITPFVMWGIVSRHKRMNADAVFNDARSFIWKAAIDVAKRQPITGYGASRAQEEFDVTLYKYETAEFRECWKETNIMHSHNQFFQTYMEFGIIGIALLLGLIFGPILLTEPKNRFFAMMIIFVILAQFMTDIVITYQGFPVIFGLLTLMTIGVKKEPTQAEICMPD